MLTVPSLLSGRNNSDINLPITVEREHGGEGWIVRRHDHGWLLGDFRSALDESAELVAIEWGLP